MRTLLALFLATLCAGTWAATQDIVVSRNGTTITYNASAPFATDTVTGTVGGQAYDLNYTITNNGTAVLNVTAAATNGALTNCTASLLTGLPLAVAAGGTQVLTVRVTPTLPGSWSFNYRLTSNDPVKSPYEYTVAGTASVSAPEIVVTRGGVNVADAALESIAGTVAGAATDLTYVITNSGTATLTLSGSATIASLTNCTVTAVSSPAGSISAGGSTSTVLRVTPTTAAAWSFTWAIATNDSDENPFNFTITGTAASAAAEINVQRGGTTIVDGGSDTITGTASGITTDFTYTIQNLGAGSLSVSDVSLSSLSNCTLVVLTAPAPSVAAAGSTTLVLQVVPGIGAWSAVVTIQNTDSNENPYNFTVSGTAIGPEMDVVRGNTPVPVNGTDVYTGTTVAGQPTFITWDIQNNGGGQLSLVRFPNEARPGTFQFARTYYNILENGGSIQLQVQRVWGKKGKVSVTWATSDLSALANVDYVPGGGVLTWDDGDDSDKTITIAVTNDAVAEAVEQISVTLSLPSTGTSISEPGNAIINIIDEDAPQAHAPGHVIIGDGSVDYTRLINEGNSGNFFYGITLTRVDGALNNISVQVSIESSSAMAGSDFVAATTTVNWVHNNADNMPTKSVNIEVIGDTDFTEPQEAITIHVHTPVGCVLGATSETPQTELFRTLFLLNDDPALKETVLSSTINCDLTAITPTLNRTDVTQYPDRVVPPAGSVSTTVRVTPLNSGYWAFRYTISDDDSNENPYTFLVTGNANAAESDVEVDRGGALVPNHGTDLVGGLVATFPTDVVYTITNRGTASLTLAGSAVGSAVNCAAVLTAAPGSPVAAGGTTTTTVRVTPTAAGPWSCVFTATTNDPDENPLSFTISGVANPAPVAEIQIERNSQIVANGATSTVSDLIFTAGQTTTVYYSLRNVGAAALTLTAPGTATPVANCAAAVTQAPVSPVNAGSGTVIGLQVTPTAAGAFSFTYLVANSDIDENPTTFTVAGTARSAGPHIAFYRSGVPVPVGGTDVVTGTEVAVPTTLSYSVTNTGTGNLALAAQSIVVGSATNCAAAIVPGSPTSPVVAGTPEPLYITVTPAGVGAWSFVYSVDTDDLDLAGASHTATMAITGIATQPPANSPEIQVSRSGTQLADGAIDSVAGSSAGTVQALVYVIDNLGTLPLHLTLPVTIGSATNCYAAVTANPAATVNVAGSTVMTIEVTPQAAGTWSFTWSVATDDSDENPTDITVTGTAAAPPGPEILVTRSSSTITDGGSDSIAGFTTGVATTINYTITNSGTSDLVLGAASLSGITNCAATVIGQPATTVPAGTTTTLQLSVNVTATFTTWSVAVSFATNDSDENPTNWTINGTASDPTPTPTIIVSRGAVNISNGAADVIASTGAGTAVSLTYTISNTGAAVLNLNGAPLVTVGSSVNCTPVVTATPATPIAIAGSSTLTVGFTPAAPGAWSFTITLPNDAPGNPMVWTVAGTAAGPDIEISRGATIITTGSTDVITGTAANTAMVIAYRIRNAGVGNLTVGPSVIGATPVNCTASVTTLPAANLAPAANTTLGITVTPAAEGAWSFTVTESSNDGDELTTLWTVSGTAVQQASTSAVGQSFGSGGCGGGGLSALVLGLTALLLLRLRTRRTR